MKTLGIVSMKGGVGKTMLAANLAAGLARTSTKPVAVIELDPQNGLAWHFNGHAAELPGISQHAMDPRSGGGIGVGWLSQTSGVRLFPFGQVEETERRAFEKMLEGDPGWLGRCIAGLRERHPGITVLIDTPPGHSVYLEQVLACADQLLMVLLPDMASLATVGDMEGVLAPVLARRPQMVNHYILNQVEPGQPLGARLTRLLQERFGPRLLPVRIHRDEAVAEALALHRPLQDYDARSQAHQDMRQAASLIGGLLAS